MASGLLPKSPVSSSLCDEVPHIFIPKSHLEPREFLISSAKRFLQQYRTKADKFGFWASDGLSANDPNVWSGRALQVDFAELAVSGLASMYPASDWSVLCSGPSWISARVRSH